MGNIREKRFVKLILSMLLVVIMSLSNLMAIDVQADHFQVTKVYVDQEGNDITEVLLKLGVDLVQDDKTNYAVGDNAIVNEPDKTSTEEHNGVVYNFLGYRLAGTDDQLERNTTVHVDRLDQNVTVHGVWEKVILKPVYFSYRFSIKDTGLDLIDQELCVDGSKLLPEKETKALDDNVTIAPIPTKKLLAWGGSKIPRNQLPKGFPDGELEFVGWYLGDQKVEPGDQVKLTESSTVVNGKWEFKPKEHTVRFSYASKDGSPLPNVGQPSKSEQVGIYTDEIVFPDKPTNTLYEMATDKDWSFVGWRKAGTNDILLEPLNETIGKKDCAYEGVWEGVPRTYAVKFRVKYTKHASKFSKLQILDGWHAMVEDEFNASNSALKATDHMNIEELKGFCEKEGDFIGTNLVNLSKWYVHGFFMNGEKIDIQNFGFVGDHIVKNEDRKKVKEPEIIMVIDVAAEYHDVNLSYKLLDGDREWNGELPDPLKEIVGTKKDEFNKVTGSHKAYIDEVKLENPGVDPIDDEINDGKWRFTGFINKANEGDITVDAARRAYRVTKVDSIYKDEYVVGVYEFERNTHTVTLKQVSEDGSPLPTIVGIPLESQQNGEKDEKVNFPDVTGDVLKDTAGKNAWVFKGWRKQGSKELLENLKDEKIVAEDSVYEGVWKKYPAVKVNVRKKFLKQGNQFIDLGKFDALDASIAKFNQDHETVFIEDEIDMNPYGFIDEGVIGQDDSKAGKWMCLGYYVNGDKIDSKKPFTIERKDSMEDIDVVVVLDFAAKYHNVNLTYDLIDGGKQLVRPKGLTKIVETDKDAFNTSLGNHKHYKDAVPLPNVGDEKDAVNDGTWVFKGFRNKKDLDTVLESPLKEITRDEEIVGTYEFEPNAHKLTWSYEYEGSVPKDKTALKKYLDAIDAFNTKVSAMTFTKGMDVVVPDDLMRESIVDENNDGAWMLKSYRVNGKAFDALNPGTFGAEDLHVVGTISFKKKSKIRFTYVHNGNAEVPNEILKPAVEEVKGFAGETVSVPKASKVEGWKFLGWRKVGQDAFVDTDALSFEETDAMYEGVWEFVEPKKEVTPSVEEKTTTKEVVVKSQKKVAVASAVMEVKEEKVPSTSDEVHLAVYGIVCLSGLIAMVLSGKKLLL